MRVIGLDPGLRRTGWGVIDSEGTRLRHVANGVVESDGNLDLARRLVQLDKGLLEVLHEYRPEEAAVEASLVNKNAGSTLKLGVARGVVLLTPAKHGLPVAEYLPMIVKKAVVGTGHASKEQVQHSHHAATERRWFAGSEGPLLGAQGDRR
jgi:crossover junction endodeoxyribonuclease RuvC